MMEIDTGDVFPEAEAKMVFDVRQWGKFEEHGVSITLGLRSRERIISKRISLGSTEK